MKLKGMLSVRLALLSGLILLSGGARSAGETVLDDVPPAIGVQALEQEHAKESLGVETGDKGAGYQTETPVTPLNFGDMGANLAEHGPRHETEGAVSADSAINSDDQVKNGGDADKGCFGETDSPGDTGNGTESGSEAGDSHVAGSHSDTDSVGGDGHSSDSALTHIGEVKVVTTVNGADDQTHATDKKDQNTQTDDFDKDKVNVNTATADELVEGLKGIGPKKAQAIIVYRDKHGPFTTIDQLKEVKGIGPATLARNKDRLEL